MTSTQRLNSSGPYVPERMLCQMLREKMRSSLLHPSRGPSFDTAPVVSRQQDEILLYCESSLTLLYDLKRSSTVTDISLSLGSFFRGITQTSVTGTLINIFVKMSEELADELPFFQSSSWIDILDDFHKNLHRVRDSVLGKKLISVFNNVIAHTFYYKMGLQVDPKLYRMLEKGYITPNVWNVATFADALSGLLLFLMKAGRQALQTGSVDPFFIDSVVISDWIMVASRLRKDAEFLGNPSAVGIAIPAYLKQVGDAIDTGKKLAKAFGESQRIIINSLILELELVQKRYISTLCAASFRFCPVGVFIFGDSGVGKSFLTKGIFYHYASVRGLAKEQAILYPRNPDEAFFSGFKSDCLGILIDDVGKHKPNKVMGIDTSIAEVIGIANNTPLITNQAELADKGKIPMLVEWMGVTSNMKDLGVHAYYNNTYAVLRRVEYRIEPIVKAQYRLPGTTRLDPSSVPPGMYPDCWRFEVCRVMRHDSDPLHGTYQAQGSGVMYESYAELLVWLTSYYQKHIDQQTKLLETVNALGPEELCVCRLPKSLCNCEGDSEIINDEPTPIMELPIAQALDADQTNHMLQGIEVRRRLVDKFKTLNGLDKLYFNKWIKEDYDTEISCRPSEMQHTFEELEEMITQDMAMFVLLPVREKLREVQESLTDVTDDESYLTFTPELGGRRNLLRSQLKFVYEYILKYIPTETWNEEKLATLELFVYEKAPRYLADGWDDPSILQAALDYVDAYSKDFIPCHARDLLLENETVTFKEKILRFFGMQYFTRPWVFKSVNWFSGTRAGGAVIERFSGVNKTSLDILRKMGDVYDAQLGGRHTLVMVIVAVCGSALFVFVFTTAMRAFGVGAKPEGQLSLEAIGVKPKVREKEKVNVWRTQERNITALDFHPRRPNKLTQLMPSLQLNSVYVETVALGVGRARTRALVINNNQILINSHACFESFTMTVYYGKKAQDGIQSKFLIEVVPEMIHRIPARDLAIIRSFAIPALFKDISRCFFVNSAAESVGPSFYSIPEEDGSRRDIDVYGVQRVPFTGFMGAREGIDMRALTGRTAAPTLAGDCGSPLIIMTPLGPIIAGIHCAYNHGTGVSYAAPIFGDDFTHTPMVQVGTVIPAQTVAQTDRCEKLYTDFHQEGNLIVFGGLKGFRARPKANGTHTEIFHHVLSKGPELGLLVTDRLTTPDMGSWEPQQNILKEYLSPTHSMNEPLFMLGVKSFSKHICNGLTQDDIEDVHVVPLSVAVNGFPGVPNVDAQKFTTSAGHGLPGPKKTYVEFDGPREEWSRFREYNDDVTREIERIYSLAIQGVRSHPIFTAQLKDEMISLAKKAAKKTRGFYMCPLAFLTVMRIFTTGLTRVMVRRRKLFRHAVGLNTHSEEWNDLHESSQKIPGDNWMAGDFRGFDKILSILIQNGGKEVILDVAKFCGFTNEELLALDTLLCDNITAVIDFFGTLIMLLGGEVSGHQITTFFNSICNVLLHLYAWIVLAKEQGFDPKCKVDEFWIKVFICVLGDDIMAKVHPSDTWYNHTTVQRVFGSIGIEYTMADKLSESVPYISCEEVGFLKRRFTSHECFPGLMIAPLEKESIYKMLMYTIPSRDVSSEEQLSMAICSALAEAFYHGKEFYNKIEELVASAPKSEELKERMLQFPRPSWSVMYERFLEASPAYRVSLVDPVLTETKPEPTDSYCQSIHTQAQCDWSVDPWGSTTMGRSPEDSTWSRSRLSFKKFAKHVGGEATPRVENERLSKNFKKQNNNTPQQQDRQMTSVAVEKVIKHMSMKNHKKNKRLAWDARGQADIRPDTEGSVTVNQQTYQFKNEATSKTVDLSAKTMSIPRRMAMEQTLGQYFSRPKLIHTFTWLESMPYGSAGWIYPWNLLLTDPSFKEKMGGFGLFRGNLHLKFTINGSPFYYGGLMAAYQPLIGYRGDTAQGNANQLLVASSQKPHVWLNVQNTSSADMILPFLAPYPFADTTAQTYTDLGRLEFLIYKALQSANGVTGSAVDVQVFAWMEDLELTGPTNQPVSQADVEYEQDRTISSTASTVANVAGALSSVPVIGPYAMATSEVAGMLGKTAELFGFTNVPNISDINPVMQTPFPLASTQISAPLTKLSLQPKQEIALGSVQHGGDGVDELTMKRFLGRESFLVGSNWSTTDVPGDIQFTSHVTPQLWQSNGTTEMAFPPMGYLSQMFQWWRGSVQFTVKVIRSKYHRGRLLLSWDRNSTNLNLGATLGNTNTFSTVLDLDETDEVTFSVPYIQARHFLRTSSVGPTSTVLWSTSGTPSHSLTGGFSNGVFNIRVLNRLTAPEATSDVEILIFVKGGEDMEMAGPRNLFSPNSSTFITQSRRTTSVAQSDIVYEEDHEISRHQDQAVSDEVYKEVFGEKIVSLRDYLHRMSLAKSYVVPVTTDGTLKATIPLKHMPVSPGFFNNGVETVTAPAGSRVNICPQHPIPWITNCFIGYKGSVNVIGNVRMAGGAPNAGYVDYLAIDRVPDGQSLNSASRTPSFTTTPLASTLNVTSVAINQVRPGVSGKSFTNTRTNTSVTANLPFYNQSGFFIADYERTYNNTETYAGTDNDWWELTFQTPVLATMDDNASAVDVFYGTGPDFDVVFFINVPLIYQTTYTL